MEIYWPLNYLLSHRNRHMLVYYHIEFVISWISCITHVVTICHTDTVYCHMIKSIVTLLLRIWRYIRVVFSFNCGEYGFIVILQLAYHQLQFYTFNIIIMHAENWLDHFWIPSYRPIMFKIVNVYMVSYSCIVQ